MIKVLINLTAVRTLCLFFFCVILGDILLGDVRMPKYAWWDVQPEGANWYVNNCGYVPLLAFSQNVAPSALPEWGYPRHNSLFKGLNDTLQITIEFMNQTDSTVTFPSDPETWYQPGVFDLLTNLQDQQPMMGPTEIKWRNRSWRNERNKIAKPTNIPPEMYYYLYLDVWNVPEGTWMVSAFPDTTNSDTFCRSYAGSGYYYGDAKNLADSVNAWEACFWRVFYDDNPAGAKKFADSIVTRNSKSVPGWRLRSYQSKAVGDSLNAIKDIDKAILYFNTNADSLMPDSTERPLLPGEYEWLFNTKVGMGLQRKVIIDPSYIEG